VDEPIDGEMAKRTRLKRTSAAARTTIGEQRKRFEHARDRLRGIPDALAAELDAIAENWELPDETKHERARRARAAAARNAESLIAEAREALELGAEKAQAMRVGRKVRSEQRHRVHSLRQPRGTAFLAFVFLAPFCSPRTAIS
jgi:hypothetical protein